MSGIIKIWLEYENERLNYFLLLNSFGNDEENFVVISIKKHFQRDFNQSYNHLTIALVP